MLSKDIADKDQLRLSTLLLGTLFAFVYIASITFSPVHLTYLNARSPAGAHHTAHGVTANAPATACVSLCAGIMPPASASVLKKIKKQIEPFPPQDALPFIWLSGMAILTAVYTRKVVIRKIPYFKLNSSFLF